MRHVFVRLRVMIYWTSYQLDNEVELSVSE